MSKTEIRRVYVEITNSCLYALLTNHSEVISADRNLDKEVSKPSCRLSVTPNADSADKIVLQFDIENFYDSRWETLFPRSNMAEINPYLRFLLMDNSIQPEVYFQFEKELIEKHEEIIQNYNEFHFLLSECYENPNKSFYTHRIEYSLRDGIIMTREEKIDQIMHLASDQDELIHYGCRKLFNTMQ